MSGQMGKLLPMEYKFKKEDSFSSGQRIYQWFNCDVREEIEKLAEQKGKSTEEISKKFAGFSLRILEDGEKWNNDPIFGFYHD